MGLVVGLVVGLWAESSMVVCMTPAGVMYFNV